VSAKALPNNCMSIDDVAKYLGVAPLTVSRAIKAKKLRASHVGRRIIIKPADVEKMLTATAI
jgi:excisionase family DNA binding protein